MNRCCLVILVMSLVFMQACKDMGTEPAVTPAPQPTPLQGTVSYQKQIAPLFQKYGCSSCHGGSGGLFVTSYAQLMQGGNHGPVVVPGNADSSNIIKKLSLNTPPFGVRMPQGGPYLPDSTIQLFRNWINQGALNN
jgi:hypothetical protein